MTLKIGINQGIVHRLRGKKGFTLVEAMVATVILSLGTTFLSESFFISLDSYNYCARYLQVVAFADEKVWEAQERLRQRGPEAGIMTAGSFTEKGRNFNWYLSYGAVDTEGSLYKIDFTLSWLEGGKRQGKIQRSAYARYVNPEE